MDTNIDNKDLNVQNYSIEDIFEVLEVEEENFKKALEVSDDYIYHFDNESNEVMSNFFLQLKDKIQEHINSNNINVYNFDDIYQAELNNDPTLNNDVNLYKDIEINEKKLQQRIEDINDDQDVNNNEDIVNNLELKQEQDEYNANDVNNQTINNIGKEYSENESKNMYMIGYDDNNIIYNKKNNETSNFTKNYNKLDDLNNINSLDTKTSERNLIFDSQFRPLGSNANDFHIDLTEPLVDILSIELIYYQFIYSIYNIDEMQNTNYFYLTDTVNTLYTITIESGLYKTPQELIAKLNSTVVEYFTNSTIFQTYYPEHANYINSLVVFSYSVLTGKTTVKVRKCFKYIKFFDLNISTGQAKINFNLGYFLGFRKQFKNSQTATGYYLVETQGEGAIDNEIYVDNTDPSLNVIVSTGILDIQNPKYLILSIDDYNQNRLNQNVITASEGTDNTIPIRLINKCNSNDINSLQIPSNPRTKSLSLLYAHNERVVETINEVKRQASRNVPAAIPDIFAMIPIEIERNLGTLISNRGVSTQINLRKYFGPVNINRFRIRLFDERGNLVNLNNSDYSFTVSIQRLYNKENS